MTEIGESSLGGLRINPDTRISVIPNRELRRVPFDWQHPKSPDGDYVRLMPYETFEEFDEFSDEDQSLEERQDDYEEMRGLMMPDFSKIDPEKIGISVYESYTEGTPISPVFPDTPEGRFTLLKYVSEKASITDKSERGGKDAKKGDMLDWAAVLFGEMPIIDYETGRVSLLSDRQAK